MPAIWGAGISAAASLAGGLLGGNAQSKAASQAAATQQQQLDFTRGVYNTAQTNLNPFINTGTSALYSLASLYGLPTADGTGNTPTTNGANAAFTNFTNTPSYQFAMQQGLLGAERGINATGVGGPAAGKALTNYASGVASQGFNGYIGQLASLAGLGQSSAANLAGVGNAGAGAEAGLAQGVGGAQASGTIGSSNSLLSGIGGAVSALGAPSNPTGTAFGASSAFGKGVSALSGLFNNSGSGGGGNSGASIMADPFQGNTM